MRHPFAAVILLVVAVSSGGLIALSYFTEPAPAESIVADVGGPIERVVISASSARSSTLRNVELINQIVNRLPPRIEILILAADRGAFSVASNPWPERVTFVDMPERYRLTIWPQDPFVVLAGADGTRLLGSPDFRRAEDSEMARLVAAELELPLAWAGLAFEGGNIVADEKHVFIGANTIRQNALELELDETEVARRFEQVFGKTAIVVGPLPQPIGHIDMMLTPLGERRLLLADPGWGARLARQALDENPGSVAEFERRSMREFFGHGAIAEVRMRGGGVLRPPEIIDATRLAIGDSDAMAAAIDGVARALTGLGFRVERMPYLERRPQKPETTGSGESIPGKAGYPQLSYNNVLLETHDGINRVYLPQYGWPAIDAAASTAWRGLGYEVVAIPGFTTSAMHGGALRCSIKVLARQDRRAEG